MKLTTRFGFVALLALTGIILTVPASRSDPLDESVEDRFAIRLVVTGSLTDGALRPYIQVFHPDDERPLAGVGVTLKLDTLEATASGMTDEQGLADVALPIPDDFDNNRSKLTVVARHRGTERQVGTWLYLGDGSWASALLGTDKALYRGGQTVHVRGLWLDPKGHAWADQPVRLTVKDPRGRQVFHTDLRTSDFGVAAADWRIPASAKDGEYHIEASSAKASGSARIHVRRYELPKLRIARAETSKPFYLPGDDAKIEVTVTTPDGHPVQGAEVTLELSELAVAIVHDDTPVARTDDEGRVGLRFDLAAAHADLEGYGYRFHDDHLVVTARDPVSGHGARARVAVRASRQPLHVYLAGDLPHPGMPSRAYVTMFSADGEPVAGQVTAKLRLEDGEDLVLDRLSTNRYGLGRLNVTDDVPEIFHSADLVLEVQAGGLLVHETMEFWDWDDPHRIGIDTSRTFYRPGDPLEVTLHSVEPLEDVVVEVRRGIRKLLSRRLEALEAPTTLVFDPRAEFSGRLDIQAFSLSLDHAGNDPPSGHRAVVFLEGRRLGLEFSADRQSYRPGQEASLRLRVEDQDPDASPGAVLGVAVVDRSLEALQELEDLVSGPALLAQVRLRENWSYAGWTGWRLLDLDPAQPQPDDLDLVAQFLLRHDYGQVFTGDFNPNGEEWELESHLEGDRTWYTVDDSTEPNQRETGRVDDVDFGNETLLAPDDSDQNTVTEVITVCPGPPPIQSPRPAAAAVAPLFTPRVRRDFRETLLWLPELPTDADGVAEIHLPLVDSVTTWSVAILASTRDGRLATAIHEVVTSSPR